MDAIPAGTLTVWLAVRPGTVLQRLRTDVTGPERPLLTTPDPESRIRTLLSQREPLYARADLRIPTDDRSVESIVAELEDLVRAGTLPP